MFFSHTFITQPHCAARICMRKVRSVVAAQHAVVAAEVAQLRQEDAERQAHEVRYLLIHTMHRYVL